MKQVLATIVFLILAKGIYGQHLPLRPNFPPQPPHHLKHKPQDVILSDTSVSGNRNTEHQNFNLSGYENKELRKWRRKKFWSICNTVSGAVHTVIGISVLTSNNNRSRNAGIIITMAAAALGTWGVFSIIKAQKNITCIKRDRLTLQVSPTATSLTVHF